MALIALTGEDRKAWLQGQATNDLRKLEVGGTLSFCLCSPTGQIISVVRAWEFPERILLAVPASTLQSVLDRIEKMVIMEDVGAEVLSSTLRLVSVQGPGAEIAISELGATWKLISDRFGFGGWDLWSGVEFDGLVAALGERSLEVSDATVECARTEAGIPEFGKDIRPKTLPPELGAAFEAAHVSYAKGCYTGQEVLMRIFSRGHTNRTWVGVVSGEPLRIGSTLHLPGGSIVGEITSAAASPLFGFVGAAMVRTESVGSGEKLLWMGGEAARPVQVHAMPLRTPDLHVG